MEGFKINQPVIFYEGLKYTFPDFTVEYLGKETIEVPKGLAISPVKYLYRITDNKGGVQNLKWSSGTGLLAPLRFMVYDTMYEFAPYETPCRITKVQNTENAEIFAFVLYPNLSQKEKLYILKPVLRKQNDNSKVFFLDNPDINASEEIKTLSQNTRTEPDQDTNKFPSPMLLELEKPLDYLNHSSHLFLILRDKIYSKPIEPEIISLYVGKPFSDLIYLR